MPTGCGGTKIRWHFHKLSVAKDFLRAKSSARGPLTQDHAVVEANISPYFETSDSPVVCQASRHRKFRAVLSQIKMIGRRGGRNGVIARKSSKSDGCGVVAIPTTVGEIDAKNTG
jgi:hypothetical protein